jgi:hypothetical protein
VDSKGIGVEVAFIFESLFRRGMVSKNKELLPFGEVILMTTNIIKKTPKIPKRI